MRSLVIAGLLGLGTLGLTAVPAQASWLSQLLRGQQIINNGGYNANYGYPGYSNYYDPYAAQYVDPNASGSAVVPYEALPPYQPQYAPAPAYTAPVYSAPVVVPYPVYGPGYGNRYSRSWHHHRHGHYHH